MVDQDGKQDLLAKCSEGSVGLPALRGGSFALETRRVAGTGWSSINSITGLGGFTIGSHGLINRLTDGRLAPLPLSRGHLRCTDRGNKGAARVSSFRLLSLASCANRTIPASWLRAFAADLDPGNRSLILTAKQLRW